MSTTAADVRRFRLRAQQLDRESGTIDDTAVLDIGVQDTGTDGAGWALANRGMDAVAAAGELATVWTIRGAPHVYRRRDLPSVARAVEPFSDADAGKRIFDASKPLKAAGIANLAALDAVAAAMRSVVTAPTVKGDVSGRLAELMGPPYLRFCRPCQATHLYEMPFRLAAFRAGLELEPGTSPPVLTPIPRFEPAADLPERLDVVRAYLSLLGPATPKHVAEYIDAPVKEVKSHWPSDAVDVVVDGGPRSVLSGDEDRLTGESVEAVRLLGPFDLFLQARDRPTLVDDPAKAKALWPVLGRPGALVVDGDIAGLWRPRQSGGKLTVRIEPWVEVRPALRLAISEQAERLAAHRGVTFSGVELEGA